MGEVFVAGSINMDVVATADRHPRIGETVAGKQLLFSPGGKGANQACAAAKLGAPTTLIGRIGTDAFGQELKAFLAAQGLDLRFGQETSEAHTGTAIITIADGDNTIVVIPGANGLVTADDIAAVPLSTGDVAVSQFEIPQPAVGAFFRRAHAAGATTILNPAPAIEFDDGLLDFVDVLILNETELGLFTKTGLRDSDEPERFMEAARTLQGERDMIVCVTLGKRGAVVLADGKPLIVEGRAVSAVDTTGAGDCFVGAAAALLADGQSMRNAIAYANVAASLSVQRIGAAPSMPTVAEISKALDETPGKLWAR
jgi:ribokinase